MGGSPSEPQATKSPTTVAHHVPPQQAGGPSAVAWPRRHDQSSPSSPCLLPHLLDNDATVFVVVIAGPCHQDGDGVEEVTTPADTFPTFDLSQTRILDFLK